MTAKIFRNAFLIGFTVLLACILLFFFIMYSNYQAQAFDNLAIEAEHQLRRAFPDSEVTPMRLFGYPFPVVMVSVTDRSLRAYARKHILRRDDKDYKQLTVPGLSLEDYREWHAGEVKGLPLLNN